VAHGEEKGLLRKQQPSKHVSLAGRKRANARASHIMLSREAGHGAYHREGELFDGGRHGAFVARMLDANAGFSAGAIAGLPRKRREEKHWQA
jgi:hypothetical protein